MHGALSSIVSLENNIGKQIIIIRRRQKHTENKQRTNTTKDEANCADLAEAGLTEAGLGCVEARLGLGQVWGCSGQGLGWVKGLEHKEKQKEEEDSNKNSYGATYVLFDIIYGSLSRACMSASCHN